MQLNISNLLVQDKTKLEAALELDSSTSRIEVQMLLQSVLNVPRSYLLAHPERILDKKQQAAYEALLQRRLHGEPIAHILGEREFFGLNFKVNPSTLIPRPETELLVEWALKYMPSPQPSSIGRGSVRVLDLGTGSGAIALSIAHSRPDAVVVAVDASGDQRGQHRIVFHSPSESPIPAAPHKPHLQ